MAAVDDLPCLGREVKDGFRPVNAWVSIGIAWLDDIQQFYKERSVIERDYAGKLSSLAKKHFEKKAKKSSAVSVGETPAATPGSLECASMTMWGTQLSALESCAAEHDRFATQLVTNVADPLRAIAVRYEELRKAHVEFSSRLERDRESNYSELRKLKVKYDVVCQEVESRRKKVDGSGDYGKSKAQHAMAQQVAEMNNVKNSYLTGINVTNKLKERYYHEYVPELLDSLEEMNASRINKLNSTWMLAADLELAMLSRSGDIVGQLKSEIPRNEPRLDTIMFAQHNGTTWQEPTDFEFEASPVWHDDDTLAADEAAKNFLRNVVAKSRSQLAEIKPEADKRRRELESVQRARKAALEGRGGGKVDEFEVTRAVLSQREALRDADRRRLTADVEISTIKATIGDVGITGGRRHRLEPEAFKIPTNCDFCGERIWGLSAKGFDCSDCGYTCHSRCEMKVPADCPGEQSKEDRKRLKGERQKAVHATVADSGAARPGRDGSRAVSASSSTAAAAAGRATHSNPSSGDTGSARQGGPLSRSDTANSLNTLSSGYSTAGVARSTSSATAATAVTAATETSASEKEASKTISTGTVRRNRIVAPPPTRYVDDGEVNKAVNGQRGAEERARMLYAYQKHGSEELTVSEGQELILVEHDDGSGWIRVRDGGAEWLVPASYAEIFRKPGSTAATRPATAGSGEGGAGHSAAASALASVLSSSSSLSSSGTGMGRKKGPAVAPKRGARKLRLVRVLYDYQASEAGEVSISEGEQVVLIGPAADGWTDVESGGIVGRVPTSYVEEA